MGKILAQETLEGRRDIVEDIYPSMVFDPFDEVHSSVEDSFEMLPPSSLRYGHPDILAKLPQMPAAHQPSEGWKWHCDNKSITSFGLEVEGWSSEGHPWVESPPFLDDDDLYWGYPFWDKEKLVQWGFIKTDADSQPAKGEDSAEGVSSVDEVTERIENLAST
jgi:hypothetical protein